MARSTWLAVVACPGTPQSRYLGSHPALRRMKELRDSPSQAEVCFAIFANVLCAGELPPGEPDIEPWECELH
jgi:hypothetical protein